MGNTINISVVFSWQIKEALKKATSAMNLNYDVVVGGPAVYNNPDYFEGFKIGYTAVALSRHNSKATFTTRGCVRKCTFCVVPKIEGKLIELDDFTVKPIVCDNNILASSKKHFDRVIDRLKPLKGIDFNQGLDARLLTTHHAQRLTELNMKKVRLAWDNIKIESLWLQALEKLVKAGIPKRKISTYILINFRDTPDDALYRLETCRKLGVVPFAMRYQPLDSMERNQYVAPNWSNDLLIKFCRYWNKSSWLEHIPFEEYDPKWRKPKPNKGQFSLWQ